MDIDFSNRVALVTGGGKGIGRAIALAFASHGAAVVVADIDPQFGEETTALARECGARSIYVPTDVSDPVSCNKMVAAAVETFDRLDIQINNAGISQPSPSVDLTPELWHQIIGINLSGVFFSCQAAGRQMLRQRSGNIISIGSIAGALGFAGRAPYCAAKAGVTGLTQALACEWAEANIRVNAVAPGYVMTDLVAANIERGAVDAAAIARRTPLGRIGQTQDVAHVVMLLASDLTSYVTGETWFVDGGWTAYGGW
ncbi:MAG: 3-oxoacyl-ACP reductase FabG [Roseiflexaceae bacterium]|nr:3-oxoacyl-ACP reductase FabG [Roseiflexaceae bacterium]